jgi:hypothetical protein
MELGWTGMIPNNPQPRYVDLTEASNACAQPMSLQAERQKCGRMNHAAMWENKCHESWCLLRLEVMVLSAIHAEAIIGNSSYGPLMGGITMVSLCGWRSSPPQRINHDPYRFHRYCVYIPDWIECPETLVWGNLCLSQQGICKMMLMSRGFQNCWKLKL